MPKSLTYNADCLEMMREMDDNAFDLAIVDPPYGIGMASGFVVGESLGIRTEKNGAISHIPRGNYPLRSWDSKPGAEYFLELQRVSVNQIIWGGNYFLDDLGATPCLIIWDKENGNTNQADCEVAWASFSTAVRKFSYMWNGMVQGEQNKAKAEKRIHPTQKPVALYKWLLTNYATEGDKILDTHLGSGSSRIAAYDLGFDFTGIELDQDYFNAQEARFAEHIKQPTFWEQPKAEPMQLAFAV